MTFIPNPVEFPGMPNLRWWEFEDRKTDFGSIQPSTTDLATLILAEFGLVYGNDWSLVPYRMAVGALSDILGIVVTDVFGVRTLVRPAANSIDGEGSNWGMYFLKDRQGERIDARLFLPPVLGKIQESAPLEKVILDTRRDGQHGLGHRTGHPKPGGGWDRWLRGRRPPWSVILLRRTLCRRQSVSTPAPPSNTAWGRRSLKTGYLSSRSTSLGQIVKFACSGRPCRAWSSSRRSP